MAILNMPINITMPVAVPLVKMLAVRLTVNNMQAATSNPRDWFIDRLLSSIRRLKSRCLDKASAMQARKVVIVASSVT